MWWPSGVCFCSSNRFDPVNNCLLFISSNFLYPQSLLSKSTLPCSSSKPFRSQRFLRLSTAFDRVPSVNINPFTPETVRRNSEQHKRKSQRSDEEGRCTKVTALFYKQRLWTNLHLSTVTFTDLRNSELIRGWTFLPSLKGTVSETIAYSCLLYIRFISLRNPTKSFGKSVFSHTGLPSVGLQRPAVSARMLSRYESEFLELSCIGVGEVWFRVSMCEEVGWLHVRHKALAQANCRLRQWVSQHC